MEVFRNQTVIRQEQDHLTPTAMRRQWITESALAREAEHNLRIQIPRNGAYVTPVQQKNKSPFSNMLNSDSHRRPELYRPYLAPAQNEMRNPRPSPTKTARQGINTVRASTCKDSKLYTASVPELLPRRVEYTKKKPTYTIR